MFCALLKSRYQVSVYRTNGPLVVREKEKWTNKETDKQYVADSLIHNYNLSYPMFVYTKFQNPRSRILDRKKFTNKNCTVWHTCMHVNVAICSLHSLPLFYCMS